MIVVVGDLMTDVIVRPHGTLVRGSDRAATIRQSEGGSGANQAAWLGHLGARVRFLGRTGAADHARHGAALAAHGVEPLIGCDPERPGGVLVTLLDPDGERSFLTDRGANDALSRDDLPDTALDGARWLHVSGYSLLGEGPRAAVLDFAATARARGIGWSVDAGSAGFLAGIAPPGFLAWTKTADMLFANADEAALLSGADDPAAQLAALGAARRCVVITRGAAGAVAAEPGGQPCHAPAPSIAPMDTTGAGDAFLAAFLLARLRGAGLSACLRAGTCQGAGAAERIGGRP